MKKTSLPIGMHDKLFKRARVTYQIERNISDLLMEKGFNRIETPTLEHFEVFGDEVSSNHYNLFDKKGALLSLRPDITSQIGRVIASTQVEPPIKFSYSGKVFNYHEEMRGLINEHT
ncbi:MAG: ATP phosphoribosyltransferase regulatory subunit, partial [Chryseobacterium sp.]